MAYKNVDVISPVRGGTDIHDFDDDLQSLMSIVHCPLATPLNIHKYRFAFFLQIH